MDDRVVLPVNTVLDGAYRIVRVVGSGGFGITYEAEDIKLRARIALKEYYPSDFGQRVADMSVRPKSERHKDTFEWGRANFVTEARTLARFEHPSIVRVSRVFETNSTAYMVMRFEQGRSFEDWLRSLDRPPTQDELDRIVAPLLDALEIMHAQKFLHRDIAPDNIIIRPDNTPVLLDFGAARQAVAERSRALTGIVKAGYSPQEQYASDGRLQGPWSDLYALGGTLYRAVTGRIPEESTLRVSDDRTPPAAEATIGSYRPGFLAAIDACLKVKPSERPQSVAKLRQMLFAPVPPSRPAPAPAPKPARVAKRLPAFGGGRRAIAVAAMLVVLGGAYGGYEYARWAENENARAADLARKTEQEKKRQAEADAARKKAEADAATRAAAEEKRTADLAEQDARRRAETAATAKKAEEEAAAAKARQEEESRRQAEAAARRKAEEEASAAAKAREEAEARRQAELAEQERRRQEAAKAIVAYDGVWEITREGGRCISGVPVFGVTITNGVFAQGYGTVSPTGEFKYLGRSKPNGPRDMRYDGKLTTDRGSGTFQADGGACTGTFTARRRG
ncbi:MAG TPA: protein kinase [Hyphomicrobiaceae bacterium]|nr:protein kinase [Hyphomicrobiaceae bacterium]